MQEQGLGARTGGVWSSADLDAAGLTRSQVRVRLQRGEWQVLRRGVFADAGVVPDVAMRAWAAILSAGGRGRARAAGRTSARLLGLPLIDDDDPLLPVARQQARHDDVAVARSLRPTGDLHPARLVLADDDRVLVGGVPALSPVRTLVDLARLLDHEALVCAVDDALHRGPVTVEQLWSQVEQRRRAPYCRRLRIAVAAADGRAESPLETLARLLLLPVVPGLVPQVVVLDRAARVVARLDLGDERLRFGVEADGARWHRGEAALAADRRREHRLAAQAWRLQRVTWSDVRRDGPGTRQRVALAVGRRSA